MKSLILIAGVLFSTMSLAASEKLVCREQSGENMTVVVTTFAELPVTENENLDERFEATIEIYGKETTSPKISIDGIVETEDVMYNFKSLNKKVSFSAYMDEMDQSSVTVNGKRTRLVCY